MIVFSKERLLFLFICFIEIITTAKQFMEQPKTPKPFVSVLTPESIKRLKEDSEKINQFRKENEFLSSQLTESIYLGGDNDTITEKKLREISFSVKCIFVDDFKVYDISGLSANKLKTKKEGHNQTIGDANIYYNFCYDLNKIDGCNYEKKQILALKPNGNGSSTDCIILANSINKGNKWSTWEDYDKKNFLQIELNSPDNKHKTYYKLKCNNKQKNLLFNKSRSHFEEEKNGTLETVLFFETQEACPKFDFYVIWSFINDYSFVFAIILIAFGIFNCVLGKKLAQYTAFILALFGVTVFTLFFFQFILPPGCARWIVWVILVIGLILGCTAGYFVFKHHLKVMSFLVGGIAGFLLGEFLYALFGNKIGGHPTLIHILFIVVSIIALVILAFIIKGYIIIFATSFIGAYAFIRGISLFAGHFPSEFTIIDLKSRGEDEQIKDLFTWRVYIYLVSIIITCGLSIYVQIKINKGLGKESETPDDNLEEKLNESG